MGFNSGFKGLKHYVTGPSDHAVYGVRLRPLACWDCGFEFHRGHVCLSVVSVVCCLRRADNLSIGDLPTVVRRCTRSKDLVNEEALAYWGGGGGLLRQKKKKKALRDTFKANFKFMWPRIVTNPCDKTNKIHWFLKFILEWNSKCFGQFLCPSSGVFFTVHTAVVHVIQVCWHIYHAVCTVKNSWWWTE